MKNKLLCLSACLSSFFPQLAIAHQPPETGSIGLTVSVFNDVAVSPLVLTDAKVRTNLILRRAGISLLWLDCGTPASRPPNSDCSAISFPQHLSVRLVSKRGPTAQDTFGQSFQNAAGEGNYALVYFDALQGLQSSQGMRSGDLLGFVIAHELGHLLLGRDSHSPAGLMSPVWQAAELQQAARGNLFFTNDQQQLIRSRYFAAAARSTRATERLQASSGK